MPESNLWIKETHVNKSENYLLGEPETFESFTSDKGKLFKSLQKQYGAASKMYVDGPDGQTRQVGWVFSKNERYRDTGETYEHQVWIEVFASKPIKHISWEYERISF